MGGEGAGTGGGGGEEPTRSQGRLGTLRSSRAGDTEAGVEQATGAPSGQRVRGAGLRPALPARRSGLHPSLAATLMSAPDLAVMWTGGRGKRCARRANGEGSKALQMARPPQPPLTHRHACRQGTDRECSTTGQKCALCVTECVESGGTGESEENTHRERFGHSVLRVWGGWVGGGGGERGE